MNATVTISVALEGNAATISAAIADLLAWLENPTISASVTPEPAPVEKSAKKERAKRVLTDEQKAAIKERFAAGKAAAQAKREADAAQNGVETEPDKNKADLAWEASKAARASAK
jgi:hypothetical protein